MNRNEEAKKRRTVLSIFKAFEALDRDTPDELETKISFGEGMILYFVRNFFYKEKINLSVLIEKFNQLTDASEKDISAITSIVEKMLKEKTLKVDKNGFFC